MNKLLGYLLTAASFIALIFRGKSLKAKVEKYKQRADQAQAVNDTRHRIDDAQAELQQKHYQETKDAKQSIDDGNRDHLDNNW